MMVVVDVSLAQLEAQRAELYAQLARLGDLRKGSVSESYRRCGKPNCACAGEGHRGHGPQVMWTRRGNGGKTVGRALAAGEVAKVRAEVEAYHAFTRLTEKILAVNEAICEARPVEPPGANLAGSGPGAGLDGEKRGSRSGSGTG
jgi:hypothetical protein